MVHPWTCRGAVACVGELLTTRVEKHFLQPLVSYMYYDEGVTSFFPPPTSILHTLLTELMRRAVSKSHPKLLLRATETVAEKMLANWLCFLLYPYILVSGGRVGGEGRGGEGREWRGVEWSGGIQGGEGRDGDGEKRGGEGNGGRVGWGGEGGEGEGEGRRREGRGRRGEGRSISNALCWRAYTNMVHTVSCRTSVLAHEL